MAAWPNTAFIPLPLHLRAGPITCVPVVGFSIGAVALKVGGGPPQVIAYVVAWALFASSA